MTYHASGPFDVNVIPQKPDEQISSSGIARFVLDKHFNGDLEATSQGQMISVGTDVEGSAVYVAVERVSGRLNGRQGTFALHHTGIMTRGVPRLIISVVPESGTGELVGIAGSMTIDIENGNHLYTFDYTISNAD